MFDLNEFTLINEEIGIIGNKLISTKKIKLASNFGVNKLNTIVKIALLTVLAGYNEENKIVVFSNENLNNLIDIDIDNFANLNLNFKDKAPKIFDVNITYQKIKKQFDSMVLESSSDMFLNNNHVLNSLLTSYDNILLLSGGIDSLAGLLYLLSKKEKVLPFWIDFGQKNRVSENKVINLVKNKLKIPVLIFKVDLKDYINIGWTRWKNGIIPGRNFLFVALASLFIIKSPLKNFKIWLCASRGEINYKHNDKSLFFYKTISKLLSLYAKKNIKVWTPFYKFNKAEIIYYWDKKWYSKYKISFRDATTCYLGNNCGLCSACCYRYINMLVAGIKDVYYKNNPLKDKSRIIRDYYIPNFKKWGKIRKIDFLIALLKNKKILPKEIKIFLEKQFKIYYIDIKRRLRSIKRVKIGK
jgi:7-cyano-7-deazaguanine synthase in queuosine biosynthesis